MATATGRLVAVVFLFRLRRDWLPVARIFTVLALFSILFVAAVLVLGLMLDDVRNPNDTQTQHWATVHRISGVAAALAVLLANAVVVTYFIGTSRWCREVTEAYRLAPSWLHQSNRLKRRTFPLAMVNILTLLGVICLGGAADPGASVQLQPLGPISWAQLHLAAAMAALVILTFTSVMEWINIDAHHQVIQQIMAEVQRIRAERGLD